VEVLEESRSPWSNYFLRDLQSNVSVRLCFQLPTSSMRPNRGGPVPFVCEFAQDLGTVAGGNRLPVLNCRYDEAAGVATLTEG